MTPGVITPPVRLPAGVRGRSAVVVMSAGKTDKCLCRPTFEGSPNRRPEFVRCKPRWSAEHVEGGVARLMHYCGPGSSAIVQAGIAPGIGLCAAGRAVRLTSRWDERRRSLRRSPPLRSGAPQRTGEQNDDGGL